VLDSGHGDGGGILSDGLLDALEQHNLFTEADCHISLYDISGAAHNKAIHLRALIGKQVFSILVDSDSSNTFLNSVMLTRIPYRAEHMAERKVKVANGQIIASNYEVKGLEWWIQGVTFFTDAKVLDIGDYDIILGMDWLESHSPMQCDWLHKKISFTYLGKQVSLQGVQPTAVDCLPEISGEQLLKLHKGNDLWALVVLSPTDSSGAHQEQYILQGIPNEIQHVIREFEDLF
jgi:hypothetical protein